MSAMVCYSHSEEWAQYITALEGQCLIGPMLQHGNLIGRVLLNYSITATAGRVCAGTRWPRGCAECHKSKRPSAPRQVQIRNARTSHTSADRDTTRTPLPAASRRE